MEKKRLFIALNLSDAARKKVYTICDSIERIHWTKHDQLHLTLSFIGNTDIEMIPQLSTALSRLKFEPFNLTISGTGFFRSNIFFLELEESTALTELKKQIDDVLYQVLKLKPDLRDYIAHITLARLKKRLSSRKLKFLTEAFDPLSHESFTVNEFILYSSKTVSSGAVHTPLKTIPAQNNLHL